VTIEALDAQSIATRNASTRASHAMVRSAERASRKVSLFARVTQTIPHSAAGDLASPGLEPGMLPQGAERPGVR